MTRLWTPIDPFFWQAVAEELWRVVREFFQKKPLVASVTFAVGAFVLLQVVMVLALFLPKSKPVEATEVSGVLRVDGAHVSTGVIQFLPKHNRRATVTIIRNGEFKSHDVEPGPYRVLCFATREVEQKKKKRGEDVAAFPKQINVIPEKYRAGVEVTIESGKNQLTLDWKGE
jgi:hypothetical protein